MEEHYQTIAKQLLTEIESGSFEAGKCLPTRTELSLRFKVARSTMDRAVAILVKRGVLESSRGSGTFVACPGRDYSIALLSSAKELPFNLPSGNARLKVERLFLEKLEMKAERAALSRFDGLIWFCPESRERAWAGELSGRLPQIVVNRDFPELNYVSTNHRGAIHDICSERLAAWPSALPVFAGRKGAAGLVWGLREEGFVDACREASRFYELLPLPEDFNEAVETLNRRFKTPLERPLAIVSGSLENTGPVMAWARDQRLKFGDDIHYSDFDNDYPKYVWGVAVTSIIQDFDMLVSEAANGLVSIIDGRASSVRKLVMPRIVRGCT